MPSDAALTADRAEFQMRLRAVEDRGAPHCPRRGPSNAICVLEPKHPGIYHEGAGFDAYGPKYVAWKGRDE